MKDVPTSSSSKGLNLCGTKVHAHTKVTLFDKDALTKKNNLHRTLERRWSFLQAIVMRVVGFDSAFDSLGRDYLWRILAGDGMPDKLLRLIKPCYEGQNLLGTTPTFDKDVYSRLPYSTTFSTGFLVRASPDDVHASLVNFWDNQPYFKTSH